MAAKQLTWPAVYFDDTVDDAAKEQLAAMVKRAHGSVVDNFASATHVVHKGAAADDDEGSYGDPAGELQLFARRGILSMLGTE